MQKPKLFTSACDLKTSNDSYYTSITALTADVEEVKRKHQHPPQFPFLSCMRPRDRSILISSMISIKRWKGGLGCSIID